MVNNFISRLDVNSWTYAALANIPVVSDVVLNLKCKQLANDVIQGISEMKAKNELLTKNELPSKEEITVLLDNNIALRDASDKTQNWALVHYAVLGVLAIVATFTNVLPVVPVVYKVASAVYGLYLVAHIFYVSEKGRQGAKLNLENHNTIHEHYKLSTAHSFLKLRDRMVERLPDPADKARVIEETTEILIRALR